MGEKADVQAHEWIKTATHHWTNAISEYKNICINKAANKKNSGYNEMFQQLKMCKNTRKV